MCTHPKSSVSFQLLVTLLLLLARLQTHMAAANELSGQSLVWIRVETDKYGNMLPTDDRRAKVHDSIFFCGFMGVTWFSVRNLIELLRDFGLQPMENLWRRYIINFAFTLAMYEILRSFQRMDGLE